MLKHIEIADEGDLISDSRFVIVDPGIRNMGQNLSLKVSLNVVFERNIFGIAEFGIGLRMTLGIRTDITRSHPFRRERKGAPSFVEA